MNIARIETTGQFEAIREEWNTLLGQSASDCVFLTHEWLFTWWKHLAGGRTLSILTARDAGRLAGVFPLAERGAEYMRWTPQALEFLGSGLIGSDYLDVIIQGGREREVMEAFAAELNRRGKFLRLSQLRRGSCAASLLGETLRARGWTAVDEQINVCPYIRLEGHSWESFLATLGSSQRYNFNRRLRNLAKSPEFAIRTLRSRADAVAAMDVVMALHHKRWGSAGASEAFQTPECVAFHREFAELAADRGWLRLMEMRLGAAPAAALYGMRYGAKFYFYQSGFDPAYSKQSVGLVMMGVSIKAALEEGASEYDLLHGEEEYKFHWAQETRELGRLELYPPHAQGRISRHAIALNRAARRMAKRVLSNSK